MQQSRANSIAVFFEGIFHKLLLNFTWWVNRKDEEGHNVFQGGFLGLDNISIFDRSAPIPQAETSINLMQLLGWGFIVF